MVFILAASVVLLDQFTKFLATKALSVNSSFCVIKNIFSFTLVHNKGGAFGILKNQLFVFILASIGAIIFIFFDLKKNKLPALRDFSLALILGGAMGNLIDRVFFGFVIDFFDFHVWPVFNIADSAITIGAVLLGWELIFKKNDAHNM